MVVSMDEELDFDSAARRIADTVADHDGHGVIIVVAGLPAAGKSTMVDRVRTLCRKSGPTPVILDKDQVAHPYEGLAMNALTGDEAIRDGAVYRRMVLPHTEAILSSAVRMMYDAGLPVLVDRPSTAAARFAVNTGRHLGRVLEEAFDRPVALTVWMDADAEVQRERMIKRALIRDDFKLADFEAYRKSLGPLADFPAELCDIRLSAS